MKHTTYFKDRSVVRLAYLCNDMTPDKGSTLKNTGVISSPIIEYLTVLKGAAVSWSGAETWKMLDEPATVCDIVVL